MVSISNPACVNDLHVFCCRYLIQTLTLNSNYEMITHVIKFVIVAKVMTVIHKFRYWSTVFLVVKNYIYFIEGISTHEVLYSTHTILLLSFLSSSRIQFKILWKWISQSHKSHYFFLYLHLNFDSIKKLTETKNGALNKIHIYVIKRNIRSILTY